MHQAQGAHDTRRTSIQAAAFIWSEAHLSQQHAAACRPGVHLMHASYEGAWLQNHLCGLDLTPMQFSRAQVSAVQAGAMPCRLQVRL